MSEDPDFCVPPVLGGGSTGSGVGGAEGRSTSNTADTSSALKNVSAMELSAAGYSTVAL